MTQVITEVLDHLDICYEKVSDELLIIGSFDTILAQTSDDPNVWVATTNNGKYGCFFHPLDPGDIESAILNVTEEELHG